MAFAAALFFAHDDREHGVTVMDASRNEIPQPIVFSLNESERTRLRAHLREASGVRGQMFSYAFLASIGLFNGIVCLRTEGAHSVFAWCVIFFYSVYFVPMTWLAFERCKIPRQSKTMLTFDQAGFSLDRNDPGVPATRISCARVRSVRATSETIGIYGALRPYTIIPKAALPDGGAQLMRFFAERIVSQGLCASTSHGVTTLANSVTPLFARV